MEFGLSGELFFGVGMGTCRGYASHNLDPLKGIL